MSGPLSEKSNDKRNMLLPIVCIRRRASNRSRLRVQANRLSYEGLSYEDYRIAGEL
jgi:hypothetical protein